MANALHISHIRLHPGDKRLYSHIRALPSFPSHFRSQNKWIMTGNANTLKCVMKGVNGFGSQKQNAISRGSMAE